MSSHFVQSELIRRSAIGFVRVCAQAQFWRYGPRVFINSIPKAGTHLFASELSRFPTLHNSRLHILTRDVNLCADNREHRLEFEADTVKFEKSVGRVRCGQFFSSHLPYDQNLANTLRHLSLRSLFVVRASQTSSLPSCEADTRLLLQERIFF